LSSGFVAQGYFLKKFIGFYLNMNMNMQVCDLQFVCRVSVRERSRGMCEYCCKSWCL